MSNETKFTKGEWFVGFNKTSVFTGSKVSGEGKVVSKCGRFKFAYRDVEECEANAQLIKTAPKLYEMLEDLSCLMTMLDEQTHPNIELDAVKHDIDTLLAESRGE